MNGDKVRIVMSSRRLSNQRKKIISMYAVTFRNRNPVSNLEGSHSEFIIRLKYGEIPRLNAFAAIKKIIFLRSKYPFVNSNPVSEVMLDMEKAFIHNFTIEIQSRIGTDPVRLISRQEPLLLFSIFFFFFYDFQVERTPGPLSCSPQEIVSLYYGALLGVG